MYEERLCVWPILGDRWIMASTDDTLVDVPLNHLEALRDVTGKQTDPTEAQQIDQLELPISDDDLHNWVRHGQEAAVISSRENLPESIYRPAPDFTGRVRLCRSQTVLCGPLFVGSWDHSCSGRSSEPLPGAGLVEASTYQKCLIPLSVLHVISRPVSRQALDVLVFMWR